MSNPFFTIGHSTRPVSEFIDLLRESAVDQVVDVRSIQRSRTNPQFNGPQYGPGFAEALGTFQIGYAHIAELGGLRGRRKGAEPSPNGFWRVNSFRNYADYAMTPPFADGLARLRRMGEAQRCAIMCAEAVWWRCHRRIIADYLLAAGESVMHILGPGHVDVAQMTSGAVICDNGTMTYPSDR